MSTEAHHRLVNRLITAEMELSEPDARRVIRDERLGLQAALQRGKGVEARAAEATRVATMWGVKGFRHGRIAEGNTRRPLMASREQWEAWDAAASEAGLSFSEWAREALDARAGSKRA